jgi:anti-sigma factor RsiW
MLQHLENNESVLLMYLAGELPAEDRAEVEQQLAADAGLRATVERLRETNDALTRVLTEADGVMLPSATEAARRSAAVRRVSRAMVKSRMEQESAAAAAAEAAAAERARSRRLRRLRIPGWAYPLATAAMILIAWVAYWGFTKPAGPDASPEAREAAAGRADYLRAVAAMQSFDADVTDREAIVSAVSAEDPSSDLGSLVRAAAGRSQQEPASEPSEQ